MVITWYGLSCLKIETRDAVLAFSPFSKSEDLGIAKSPRFKADIVYVSQDTTLYNGVSGIENGFVRIDEPGEYEVSGVFAYGMPAAAKQSANAAPATLFMVRAEGITIGYLGGLNDAKLPDDAAHKLEGVHILFVPVGGAGVCSAASAATIVNQIEPSLVVPMHYKVHGMKGRMDGVDAFLKEINMKADEQDKFSVKPRDIPEDETRLVLLKPQLFAKS